MAVRLSVSLSVIYGDLVYLIEAGRFFFNELFFLMGEEHLLDPPTRHLKVIPQKLTKSTADNCMKWPKSNNFHSTSRRCTKQ